MPYTAAEIAQKLDGEVRGQSDTVLSGFAPADRAQPGDLTFAENETYFQRAEASAASAILIADDFKSDKKTLIRVPNARIAFAKVLPIFFPEPALPGGIHPTAVVSPSAKIDATARIGPHCVVGDETRIDARVVLHGGNHVGFRSQIGEDTMLFPNVTLYPRTQVGKRVRIHASSVIGSDGFGYVLDNGAHLKVPQVGNVVIGDDVEIGACVTVDRGALGATTIGKGSKIDNLVQIGHNVGIGEHVLLIAQVGIAGSSKLGNYTILGGQVGVAGHLRIGNNVTVYAQSGVMHDVKDGEQLLGTPAVADRQAKRQYLGILQLPELIRRVHSLERKLSAQSQPEKE